MDRNRSQYTNNELYPEFTDFSWMYETDSSLAQTRKPASALSDHKPDEIDSPGADAGGFSARTKAADQGFRQGSSAFSSFSYSRFGASSSTSSTTSGRTNSSASSDAHAYMMPPLPLQHPPMPYEEANSTPQAHWQVPLPGMPPGNMGHPLYSIPASDMAYTRPSYSRPTAAEAAPVVHPLAASIDPHFNDGSYSPSSLRGPRSVSQPPGPGPEYLVHAPLIGSTAADESASLAASRQPSFPGIQPAFFGHSNRKIPPSRPRGTAVPAAGAGERRTRASGSSKGGQTKRCPICHRKLRRDLTRHMRIHEAVAEFACPFPRKNCTHKHGQFNRPYEYKKHLMNCHFTFDNPIAAKDASNLSEKLQLSGECQCGYRVKTVEDWIANHIRTNNCPLIHGEKRKGNFDISITR